MAEFIVNPRRAPRLPARCRAAILTPAGAFEAETEDIGARGCQVVSPRLVKKGDPVRVTVAADRVPDELRTAGKVAWVSEHAPWRVGIAFDDARLQAGEVWCEKLVAASPGLGALRRVPERIALDATVFLGPPPRFLLDFTAEEAALLRAIGSGVRIDELKVRLRDRWPAAQCALFSLLARQAVTLSRGQAAHPDAWKKILTEVEASLAVEFLGNAPPSLVAPPEPRRPAAAPTPRPLATPLAAREPAPPPRVSPPATPLPVASRTPFSASGPPAASAPPASPWGTPARDPHPQIDLPEEGPPLEVELPTPVRPRGAARAEPTSWSAPAADFEGAGGGWRTTHERSARAQALYEQALGEIRAGHVSGAIALLRQALAVAPGDPEIAATLGKLAFGDPTQGTR